MEYKIKWGLQEFNSTIKYYHDELPKVGIWFKYDKVSVKEHILSLKLTINNDKDGELNLEWLELMNIDFICNKFKVQR